MKLLVCVINDNDILDDVVSALVEIGVSGATIVESQGMGSYISEEIPIFAGFKNLLSGSRPFNHTVFSVMEDDLIDDAMRIIKDIYDTEHTDHAGVVFTVPVDDFVLFTPDE